MLHEREGRPAAPDGPTYKLDGDQTSSSLDSLPLGGVAYFDLTPVPPDRWRHRLSSLRVVPRGARAVVMVGALAVEPEAARLLSEYARRVAVEVWGTPENVQRWHSAIRAGGGLW